MELKFKEKLKLPKGLKPLKKEIESASEDKSESPHTEVAEFIDCILTGSVIAHKMHLREKGPGSLAAHLALGELYELLRDHSDTLAEKYQGMTGSILPNVSEVDQMEYLKMNHLEYVDYLIKDVKEDRKCFGDDSALQNIVDELLGDLYKVRYKLLFLQ